MLLPSCGIVLVISTFFSGRTRRRSRNRTPRRRIASAVGFSLSVRQTSRLCGGSEISRGRNPPRTSGRSSAARTSELLSGSEAASANGITSRSTIPCSSAILVASGSEWDEIASHFDATLRSARISRSGPAGSTAPSDPDRSFSDLCNASKILLMILPFRSDTVAHAAYEA